MDLSVVYTKTAKGLRARASLIGGLPSHLMKVLAHVDGTSKVETILVSLEEISEQKLIVALNLLEREGYIKPVMVAVSSEDEWAPATIFAPMEVEEFENVEEVEVKAKENVWQEAQRKIQAEEEARQQAELKAREIETQAQEKAKAKEKIRVEAKVKAQLEADRLSREKEEARKKSEETARAKAEAKAKVEHEARTKEERKAQAEKEARLKAEAEEKAKIEQKEHVRREIVRIAREAEEAEQKKAEEVARAKAEAARIKAEEEARKKAEEAKQQAEQAKLQAQHQAAEAAQKAKQAEQKAQEEAKQARAKAEVEAKEEARRELERINREAEARAKAEEEARLEAERKAKAEEKARLKAEAEEKAKAQALEKEQEKAQEKAKDRQEIARIVREAEETRKKADAQAKEERLEAKRQARAEQDARLEAKRKPKVEPKPAFAKVEAPVEVNVNVEVEEIASADANLNASLAMQYFVTNDTEESEKSEAETSAEAEEEARVSAEKARLEAARKANGEIEAKQIRIKAEAEEQAKAEAKENARFEMERISREADAARQKHEAELRSSDEITANEVAKSRSWDEIEEEEERAFKEEELANKKVAPIVIIDERVVKDEEVAHVIEEITQKEVERQGRDDIKRLAKEEAEALAKTYAKRSARLLNYGKWLEMAKKALLIYLPLSVFSLVGLLHFINISPLIAPIEKLATESIGAPVTVNEVHASLWPQPHLVLSNVAIGDKDGLKIEAINVLPDTSSILEKVKLVKSLEFEGLKITQDNFGQPQPWINNLGKAKNLKIEQINLKKIVLQIRELAIGTFDGKVELSELRELKSYHLNSNTLSAQITPQGSSFDVALTGTSWPLPMHPKVVFDEIKAKGKLDQTQINFSEIVGNIYGGNLKAKAAVDWSSEWSAAGNFDLSNATLPRLLSAFGSSASIDGKLELAGLFSTRSAQAAQLLDAPEIVASFEVRDGKINGVDLTRAVLFRNQQSLAGDPTQFDTLTGNVELKSGAYQYRQLALDTAQFHARGNLDIQANQDISGKVSADLAAQSRRLQARFDLAGKVGAVQRQ